MNLLLLHSQQGRHRLIWFSWLLNVWRGHISHIISDVALHSPTIYFPEKERELSFCTIFHNHRRSLSLIIYVFKSQWYSNLLKLLVYDLKRAKISTHHHIRTVNLISIWKMLENGKCLFAHAMKVSGVQNNNIETLWLSLTKTQWNILQNNFYCVLQKKECHNCLEQNEGKYNRMVIFYDCMKSLVFKGVVNHHINYEHHPLRFNKQKVLKSFLASFWIIYSFIILNISLLLWNFGWKVCLHCLSLN